MNGFCKQRAITDRDGHALPGRRVARLMSAVLLTVVAATAQAQDRPGHGPRPEGAPGRGMAFGGSPEHMMRSLERLLDSVEATEAQRVQIRRIAAAAAADLKGQREAERGLRERGLQLLTAPDVDADAAEALRVQLSAQRDQASRRVLQALLEVSGVLTPEQRVALGQRMRDHENMMRNRTKRPLPPSAPPR